MALRRHVADLEKEITRMESEAEELAREIEELTGRRRGSGKCAYAQRFRSRVRYWMASPTCSAAMVSLSARSAMVRATFKIRS